LVPCVGSKVGYLSIRSGVLQHERNGRPWWYVVLANEPFS